MDPVLYVASLSRRRLIMAGIAALLAVTAACFFFGGISDARPVAFVGLFLTVAALSDFSRGSGGPAGGGGDGGGAGGGGAGGGHGGACGPGGPC